MHTFAQLLISEVQKRPVLWNRWDENYKNRVLVDKEWENVAVVLKKDTSKAHTDGSCKTEDIALSPTSSGSATGKRRVVTSDSGHSPLIRLVCRSL